jgi:hypothetical protein
MAFILVLGLPSAAGAQERCLLDLSETPEPYYVLGSLVTPQATTLYVGDCGKSRDEVLAELRAGPEDDVVAVRIAEVEPLALPTVGPSLTAGAREIGFATRIANAARDMVGAIWDAVFG